MGDEFSKEWSELELSPMAAVSARHLLMALLLHANGKQTASTLAAWMGVDRRTVSRDKDALAHGGIEVRTHKGAHGGFALGPRAMPQLRRVVGLAATPEERDRLHTLRDLIADLPVPLRPDVWTLLEQLLREDDLADLPAEQRARLEALRSALARETCVSALIRRAPQEEPEQHTLRPMVVLCCGDVWHILSFSPDGHHAHLHHLSQIEEVTVLDMAAAPPAVLEARRPAK
jgi:predicted DNA-binding transcriptional regulator YafY